MFNVTAECVALYISLIIGLSVSFSITKWDYEKKMFVTCSFCIAVSSFFNILSAFFINNYGLVPIWANYAATMLYFTFLFFTMASFFAYFMYIIDREDTAWKKRYIKAVEFPLYAMLAVVYTTPFTKLMFSFDGNGYIRGPLSKLTYIFMIYVAVLLTVAAFRNGKKTTFRVKLLVLFFPILSGIIMLVQFFESNILLTGTSALGPLILMFLFISSDLIDIDSDTGFFGTKSFVESAEKRFGKGSDFCCILVSIDNKQELKDTFGSMKLRQVINLAAAGIENVIPRIEGFRYSDTKFAFIIDKTAPEYINSIIGRINDALSGEYSYSELEVDFKSSIAAVNCPEQADNADRLIELLEYCIQAAGKSKKTNIFFCDDDAIRHIGRKKKITEILKRELNSDDNNFEIFYQPIYAVSEGKFRTAEALVRLNKTEIGPIYPDEFIPIAEEMGMIVRLGDIVLEKSCRFIAELIKEDIDFDAISVNFSVHQIMRGDMVEKVMKMVKKYNIPPEKLRIEITESVIIDNFQYVKKMMNKLGDIGIKFYMDDFGTGYSNLSNMIELPFEYLKIDKSLVHSAEKSEKAYFILTFISQAFIKQDIKILTEGVETENQERIVDTIGASYIQGFRFARPVSGDTAKEYFLGIRNDAI